MSLGSTTQLRMACSGQTLNTTSVTQLAWERLLFLLEQIFSSVKIQDEWNIKSMYAARLSNWVSCLPDGTSLVIQKYIAPTDFAVYEYVQNPLDIPRPPNNRRS